METPVSSISVEEGLTEEKTAGGTISSSFLILTGSLFPPVDRTPLNMKLVKDYFIKNSKLKTCMDNGV